MRKKVFLPHVNRILGLPRVSAFPFYSDSVNFDNSQNNAWNKGR